eukprot:14303749-Alexandrium_andersonii.AAC.1
MYDLATAEKHSFWYVNLLNEREEMVYKGFGQRVVPSTPQQKGMSGPRRGNKSVQPGRPAPQLPAPRPGPGA